MSDVVQKPLVHDVGIDQAACWRVIEGFSAASRRFGKPSFFHNVTAGVLVLTTKLN